MEALTPQTTAGQAVTSCWRRGTASFQKFVVTLLIVALGILFALLLLKDNLNNQIRHVIEKQLTAAFSESGVTVSIDQAEFRNGQGIRLRGVSLQDGAERLIFAEKIVVSSEAEFLDLITKEFQLKAVEVDGLKIFARQKESLAFNLQEVFSRLKLRQSESSSKPPWVRIRNCIVSCQMKGVEDPVELSIRKAEMFPRGETGEWVAKAILSSDYFKEIAVSADYIQGTQAWRIWGNARRFWLTREMFQQLPGELRDNAQAISSLNAKIDFDFEVAGELQPGSVPNFYVIGNISDGVINDERLPFPVNNLNALFQADNTGIKFENVIAESLLGQMHLNFKTEGLTTDSPFELVANVDPLYLDQRLADKLPPEAREFLRKYAPTGDVRLNSKLTFQNGRWVPDVVVDLLDVSFAFHKFPYPLTNATGRISLDDQRVTIDVVAYASGKRVLLNGSFLEPGPDSHGQLKISMDGTIPIDAKIIAAMQKMPDIENLTRKFHPRGQIGFRGLINRSRNSRGRIEELFRHEVSVRQAEFKYDLVPIPFEDVNGSIVITESGTSFIGFQGKHVNSTNVAQGSWDPGNGVSLTIDSYDVELNDSLKSALPPKAIEFWDQLRPTGLLQTVRSKIRARPGKPIQYDIKIDHDSQSQPLSLNPLWFPYELKDVQARVLLQPGKFEIERLKGNHRKTGVIVRGRGQFYTRGWECHLEQLHFDRLTADREFTSALPKALGDTIESFDVKGLFNVGGSMKLVGLPINNTNSISQTRIQTSWDLTADIDRGYLMCGVALEDIYGAVRLTGKSDGKNFTSLGGMEVDSLVWNGVQFKKIRSPIYLDNNEALLGLWATAKKSGSSPQRLTGVIFDGNLAANARFSLHGNQPFEIQATLNDGDLREFTFELAPNYENVVGKGGGGVRITGDRTGTHALRGNGEITLKDAKISEVPVMLSMLKLLSVKQVDRTLFNESTIRFRMLGEHLYFDDLEFRGDAISIKGNGEMDFDQKLDLQFYTAVGRRGFQIPVISPVLGVASRQILVIDVKGTASNPKVNKNFFKLLNGGLKKNLEELEDSLDEGSQKIREAAERPFEGVFR